MLITVCDGDKIANVNLTADCPVENLLVLVMIDLDRGSHDASFVRLLKDNVDVLGNNRTRTLAECGLVDGDLLLYSYSFPSPPTGRPGAAAVAPGLFPGALRSVAPVAAASSPAANPSDPMDEQKRRLAELLGQSLQQINQQNLIPRIMTQAQKDEQECRELFQSMQQVRMQRKIYNVRRSLHDQYMLEPTNYEAFKREFESFMADERRNLAAMEDQGSAEGQKLVLEVARCQNLDRMYNEAFDRAPDAFYPAHLLYVKIVVNGVAAFAFVDPGAQDSVMSWTFAKKAGLEHLVDTRILGPVSELRQADRNAGTIYACDFAIGNAKFETKIDVAEYKHDVRIGMDFLRRHGCCIDLALDRLTLNDNTFAEFINDGVLALGIDEYVKFEAKVAELVAMGFHYDDAVEVLTDPAIDVTEAARILNAQKDAAATAAADAEAAAADAAAPAEAMHTDATAAAAATDATAAAAPAEPMNTEGAAAAENPEKMEE